MKILYKGRGKGKTTELIEYAATLKGYNLIVCCDKKEALRLWEIIREKKYKLPMPISFEEFTQQKYYGPNINAFLIDNADLLIQYLSPKVSIEGITFNKTEEDLT